MNNHKFEITNQDVLEVLMMYFSSR